MTNSMLPFTRNDLLRCAAILLIGGSALPLCAQEPTAAEPVEPDPAVEATRARDAWLAGKDGPKRKELADDAAHAAVRAEHPEWVIEIATDGHYAERKIELPQAMEKVTLEVLRTWPDRGEEAQGAGERVIRRMTAQRFEVWEPKRGWLFDARGKLLAEAMVPRRDGTGRQWFGAFLPDGQWVTTDLWDLDCTLSFFSRENRWLREMSSAELVPPGEPDDTPRALLGWARCDAAGKGWVVSVGANGGRGVAWAGARKGARVLENPREPWKLCFPRDLEPKGMYIALTIPNDAGTRDCNRGEPGHGMFVGFPTYSTPSWQAMVPDGATFGFWPKSDDVYILREVVDETKDPQTVPWSEVIKPETWLYRADGKFTGWIAARRVADAAKGDAMLFADGAGGVVTLSREGKVLSAVRMVWPDGKPAKPRRLFADLKLGLFEQGDTLTLARWKD